MLITMAMGNPQVYFIKNLSKVRLIGLLWLHPLRPFDSILCPPLNTWKSALLGMSMVAAKFSQ